MTEPEEGFLLLFRRFFRHPYWTEKRVFSRAEAWVDCMRMAAFADHKRLVGAGVVELGRGEFLASERFLEKRWRWSRGRVRRWIAAAREANELRPVRDTADGTVYLVVAFDDYQSGGTSDETPTVPARAQHEPSNGPNRSKGIKGSKGNKEEKKTSRAFQLPDDWKPNDAHHELARSLGVVMKDELPQFKDHHLSRGSTFKDWDRAFNTWLRNAKKFQRVTPAPRPASEKPRQDSPRGDNPVRLFVSDGGAVDPVEEDIRKVAQWESRNSRPAREAVMAEAAQQVKTDPQYAHLAIAGDNVLRGAIDARYRKLVLELIARAA